MPLLAWRPQRRWWEAAARERVPDCRAAPFMGMSRRSSSGGDRGVLHAVLWGGAHGRGVTGGVLHAVLWTVTARVQSSTLNTQLPACMRGHLHGAMVAVHRLATLRFAALQRREVCCVAAP